MKNEEKLKEVLDGMDNEFYPNDFIYYVRLIPLYVIMPFLNTNCIFNPETYTWTKKVVGEIQPKTSLEILEEIFKDLPNRFDIRDFARLLPEGFYCNEFKSYVDEFARPENNTGGTFYIKFEPKPAIEPMHPKPLETEIFAAINLLKSNGYVIYKSC